MRRIALASLIATSLAAPSYAQSGRLTLGIGRTETPSTVFVMNWHSAPRPAGWSYAAGLHATSLGSAWIGVGASYSLPLGNSPYFLRGTFMPGLYTRGSDMDLGGPLQFTTSVEFGTTLRNDAEVSLLLLHRSNGGIYRNNPGVNALSVNYTIPLN
ncbi:acyloxyacyl hydrolase [Pararhodobacter oceanensis]|nr:acyloxyacyl hydrolase [Pararhodobacter oceanensis]